jgi:hypothetical protein
MSIPLANPRWIKLLQLLSVMLLAAALLSCAQTPKEPPLSASSQQDEGTGGSWLDHVPVNWNRRMRSLPPPLSLGTLSGLSGHCLQSVRQAQSPFEQALVRAGWLLYEVVQSYGNTQVVMAMSGVDGMCRPLGYQAFVYWEGRYAGTLAPTLMNSRTDGALTQFQLESSSRIVAAFTRYREKDPLCCPSRISRVTYEVIQDDAPLVIPLSIDAIHAISLGKGENRGELK